MARVFVSYRRADGAYGVGWLAERLRTLDVVGDVQTAFHDVALRAGDNFAEALEEELAACDLVIAMIGPEWLGESENRPARILDAGDWVVREIATAMKLGKRIMPVVMAGTDHPLPSQLHASIAELAELHAVPFADERDLDAIIEQVESQLVAIDEDRARRAGLDEPIVLPELPNPAIRWRGGAMLGLIGAAVGLGMASTLPNSGTSMDVLIPMALPFFYAVALAGSVVGCQHAMRLLEIAAFQWRRLAGIVGVVVFAVGFSIASALRAQDPATTWVAWVTFGVGVVTILPWTLAMNAAGAARPRAPAHQLADRVRYLGIVATAERWASMVQALYVTAGVLLTAALMDKPEPGDSVLVVAFALLIAALHVGGHMWNVALLREQHAELEPELAELPPRFRDNARPELVLSALETGRWGFWTIMALPVVGALLMVTMR